MCVCLKKVQIIIFKKKGGDVRYLKKRIKQKTKNWEKDTREDGVELLAIATEGVDTHRREEARDSLAAPALAVPSYCQWISINTLSCSRVKRVGRERREKRNAPTGVWHPSLMYQLGIFNFFVTRRLSPSNPRNGPRLPHSAPSLLPVKKVSARA